MKVIGAAFSYPSGASISFKRYVRPSYRCQPYTVSSLPSITASPFESVVNVTGALFLDLSYNSFSPVSVTSYSWNFAASNLSLVTASRFTILYIKTSEVPLADEVIVTFLLSTEAS